MIRLLAACADRPEALDVLPPEWALPAQTVWIDLIEPTREEELAVERALGFQIPTREEMTEIEASSRLYRHSGATFVTVDILHRAENDRLLASPVTFVLSNGPLVTVRYTHPNSFRQFDENVERDPSICGGPVDVLLSLLEAVVDRIADLIEVNSEEVETLSADVFNTPGATNFTRALQRLGRAQHVNARIADSLASLGLALTYLGLDDRIEGNRDAADRLRSMARDGVSLTAHTSGVAQSVNFQLSAALGLINIEQSGIIKIFSVAAVAFLPPTLIASIYGMNFRHMPELNTPWAYPVAIAAMVVSAVLPLWWFKRKGWL